MGNEIRVLVVDDSAMVRQTLSTILSSDNEIRVIGAARDPYEARDILVREKPDVVTLDIEMPRMDGVSFLRKYMRTLPVPTVIISSLAEKGKKITIEALEAGAVDIITKPKVGLMEHFESEVDNIIRRVKSASRSKVDRLVIPQPSSFNPVSTEQIKRLDETTDKVIGIGASTGGVEHLARIMPSFPASSPGIVIVQHMPEGFTNSFSARLNDISKIRVKEAEHGDRIMPGLALLAPGGSRHMKVVRSGGQYRVELFEGEKVSFNRPAVDVLFDSIASYVGKNSACVLMTGMGKDGAKGLLKVKKAGGSTIIQDERTCVIFGMPGEAKKLDACDLEVPLNKIPSALISAFSN